MNSLVLPIATERTLTPSAPAVVRARDVSKSFDTGPVLEDVNVTVLEGQVLALCGPSGSGKSTLLRIMSGLEAPSRGEVRLGGLRVSRQALLQPGLRGRIGFVFQRPALYPNMIVQENVALALRLVKRYSARDANEASLAALADMGLANKANAYPSELSGGQQQRAAIARALAMQPDVLLLDEPTSALDPELVQEVLDVLRKLAMRGTTMVVATHELAFAREVSHQVAFFDHGRNLETTDTHRFFSAPATERAARFINNILSR
ncbi:amino acid ABC transporter ATP-binding protein [Burkholderia cepacia]|uniref:amino acid ABC transporter ATP-binding protein n=1 Tax=Burkholderia cepacia TaxID=292 RepID=UPI002AB7037D|nr:amino acid ABC transporter ATP-binding protein [Burkholderia cepacia]